YDICPVNIVLNYLTNKLDLDYDDRGSLAKTGIINNVLLNELNALPFYQQLAPKSLGFEFVVNQIFPLLNKYNLPIIDLLRTYTEHIAQQLAQNLRAHKSVLVTGGGAYNQFLIKRFKELSHCELTLPPSDIIEFKEALIFAFLGLLRLENKVNCLKSVTGASKDHSSGKIF
ncbi:MAG: anhydro-N-acetylmuramic acid kinase, partial [Flavobacteriales bacterium CG03_land_8_20_14_0_80_35_15]